MKPCLWPRWLTNIERAFRNHETYDKIKTHRERIQGDVTCTAPSEESARIIGEYLGRSKPIEYHRTVRMLVSSMRWEATKDQDLLKTRTASVF